MTEQLPKPTEEPWTTCDWGGCDEDSVDWRWAADLSEWLPVCRKHQHWRARNEAANGS